MGKAKLYVMNYLSRLRGALTGSLVLTAAQACQMLAILLTSVFMGRTFGLAGTGTYFTVTSLLEAMAAFSLPFFSLSLRKAVLQGDEGFYWIVTRAALVISLVLGVTFFLLNIFGVKAHWMGLSLQFSPFVCGIVFVFLVVSSFDKYEVFLMSRANFQALGIVNLSALVVTTGGFFAVLWGVGNEFYVIWFVFVKAVRVVLGNLFVRESLRRSNEVQRYREYFLEGVKYTLVNIPGSVTRFDRVILGLISAEQLALYNVGSRIAEACKDMVKNMLFPIYNRWLGQGEQVSILKLRQHALALWGLGLCCSAGIVALASVAIPLLYGQRFSGSILVVLLLSVIYLPVFFNTVAFEVDVVQGAGSWYRKLMLMGPFVYAACLFFFLPRFKMYGLIFAVYVDCGLRTIMAVMVPAVLDLRRKALDGKRVSVGGIK